jgi:hypothetical protein
MTEDEYWGHCDIILCPALTPIAIGIGPADCHCHYCSCSCVCVMLSTGTEQVV